MIGHLVPHFFAPCLPEVRSNSQSLRLSNNIMTISSQKLYQRVKIASRGAGAVVDSITATSSNNESKRGIEFRHSTRKTSRIQQRVGNRSILKFVSQVPSAYPTILGIHVKLKKSRKY